jgi:hypothetical protein
MLQLYSFSVGKPAGPPEEAPMLQHGVLTNLVAPLPRRRPEPQERSDDHCVDTTAPTPHQTRASGSGRAQPSWPSWS